MEALDQGDAYGGRGPEIMGVAWALMGLTSIVILLRLYVRIFMFEQVKKYKDIWATIWTVLAWLFGVLGTAFLSVAVHYGFGNRIGDALLKGDLKDALLFNWIWWSFSTLMIVWSKFSVVAFLFDVQRPIQDVHKWILLTLVGFTLCTNLVGLFLTWFQCSPARKLWEPSTPGECRLTRITFKYNIFSGSWSAFVDLYLAIDPIYTISNLQVSSRLRASLYGVLALGLLACACGCMRTYELTVIERSTDMTYASVPLVLWSMAESWIVLIAAGMLPIWPLLKAGLDSTDQGPDKDGLELELSRTETSYEDYLYTGSTNSNRTSATTATTVSDTSTLHDSIATVDLEGAIAVKREVTIDRERRKRHHGTRPRASTRSWAAADRTLARWSSTPRSPSWVRGLR